MPRGLTPRERKAVAWFKAQLIAYHAAALKNAFGCRLPLNAASSGLEYADWYCEELLSAADAKIRLGQICEAHRHSLEEESAPVDEETK